MKMQFQKTILLYLVHALVSANANSFSESVYSDGLLIQTNLNESDLSKSVQLFL